MSGGGNDRSIQEQWIIDQAKERYGDQAKKGAIIALIVVVALMILFAK